ncbi:type II methionyl aminopeptidase [Candidatus Woesearchaeota archaeon]|nr:type II methionyl aminopeptidase [Candidatus Woesearchaeota archaeon]MCF7901654.1 type II methionyl aminopeptidase [Candidatus Woesearchaeota archaeon]MCF8013861.1 type II methionyl aminopeptidase [Candidatus Woesearchaeota archaeon]
MNSDELNFLKKSGVIAASALNHGAKLIKPGESVVKILDEVEKYIKDKDADLAFPAQISINSTAAHFCPTDENDIIIQDDDVVKLDCGVSVNGYIADNAKSVCPSGVHNDLIEASRDALNAAIKVIKNGVELREIGKEIQEVISAKGFSPIRNLSGHGLDKFEIHASPTIPNFDTGDDSYLETGNVIAIEPFASKGAGIVYESSNSTLFTLNDERPVRSSMTRDVLKEIKSYGPFPFTSRWLIRKFGVGKVSFALREMKQKEMLDEHPPLIDKDKGLVSQAEHSVIVDKKPVVYTRLEDD